MVHGFDLTFLFYQGLSGPQLVLPGTWAHGKSLDL